MLSAGRFEQKPPALFLKVSQKKHGFLFLLNFIAPHAE
jgi:hypothetical protein